MLTSIRLRNFKSFADAEAPLGPLTLLLGANASGKSNVLDALRFLNGAATRDLPIDQLLQGQAAGPGAGWPGIRGGIHEAIRNGADAFSLDTICRLPSGDEIAYAIACAVAPHPHVRAECVCKLGSPDAALDLTPTQVSARWPALARVHLGALAPAPGDLAQSAKEALSRLTFLDMIPARMRRYVPQEMLELGDDGENLSAVLFQLCKDAERKQGIIDWLAELCAPELAAIDFSTTDEGEVMLRLVEKDGIRVSARSLSDGTLRFLGELVALRTAREGSVILVEELGHGLHPRRMHLLVEYLEAITEERNIQVIATTHSPLVLQALGPKARGDAVVLGRVPDRPGTVMRRLADLPRFEEIVERRGVDYLFTTGWLEQAL